MKETKMLVRITSGWQNDFYFLYTFIRFYKFSTLNTNYIYNHIYFLKEIIPSLNSSLFWGIKSEMLIKIMQVQGCSQ